MLQLGAEVIYEKMYDVHVSGHACQDEQKLMMALTRPKYILPVHGEYKHLRKYAMVAKQMGIDEDHVIIPAIGQVLEQMEKYSVWAVRSHPALSWWMVWV